MEDVDPVGPRHHGRRGETEEEAVLDHAGNLEEGARQLLWLGNPAKRCIDDPVTAAGEVGGARRGPAQLHRTGEVEGRRVVIVGDVLHSRVARSNVALLNTLGAEVVLGAPPTLLPVGVADWGGATISHDLDAELPAADAVMMLRVQAERMNGAFFPSEREYSTRYGLSERRQAMLPEHAVLLHPGPMLRGMEISFSVPDSSQSAVLQQVSNGVHVRMAVLFHLLVGTDEAVSV